MPLPTLRSLFRVGDKLEVDGINHAYIIDIHHHEDNTNIMFNLSFSVRYVLDRTIEHNITYDRVKPISLNHLSFNRSGLSRIDHYNNTNSMFKFEDLLVESESLKSTDSKNHANLLLPPEDDEAFTSHSTDATSTNENQANNDDVSEITYVTNSTSTTNSNTQTMNTNTDDFTTLQNAINDSIVYFTTTKISVFDDDKLNNDIYPIFKYIKQNNSDRQRGWIRDVIDNSGRNDDDSDVKRRFLSLNHKKVLAIIVSLANGVPFNNNYGFTSSIAYAFDVHRNTVINSFKSYILNDFNEARKKRKDANETVFNNDRKRRLTFTPFHAFKKAKYSGELRDDSTVKWTEEELKHEFENLPLEQKEVFNIISNQNYERSVHFWPELKSLLLRSQGRINYRSMSANLGNIVCHQTIANYLNSIDGFKMRKDRILPHLSRDAMERRYKWAQTYWMFWSSVKAVPNKKVAFVLLHLDEKWFYAIRCRTNTKVLTCIGLDPSPFYCQHRCHIGKQMYVVATAFVIEDNDITKGGYVVPIACIRVGKFVTAKKDSYKRVYDEDGNATYPKVPENRVRVKGQKYFRRCELSGSSEGTEKKPKISLLNCYINHIIPSLKRKVVDKLGRNSDGTRRKVVIVRQEDNAGLHQDKKYKRELEKIFLKEDWLSFNQPSQSPVTNVHDACIFPMMSRVVSQQCALEFGSTTVSDEDLDRIVMNVFNDSSHRLAMSRAFCGNHQIALAILHCNGDNDYLKHRKGMSFGIRKSFMPTQDGNGVTLIDHAPENFDETTQGQLLAANEAVNLKYKPPDVRELVDAKLTNEMKDLLMEYMDPEMMSKELHEVWQERILVQMD